MTRPMRSLRIQSEVQSETFLNFDSVGWWSGEGLRRLSPARGNEYGAPEKALLLLALQGLSFTPISQRGSPLLREGRDLASGYHPQTFWSTVRFQSWSGL